MQKISVFDGGMGRIFNASYSFPEVGSQMKRKQEKIRDLSKGDAETVIVEH